jgi:hypothetical protein
LNDKFIIGYIDTAIGKIPVVSTAWSALDKWGAVKTRWGIGRMNYSVNPGIYAVGRPDENSLVFVTANYKLSFDHLRRSLEGINAWILVINTFGINVWCAAGKGTFGTKELVHRIKYHDMENLVSIRKIIVPQLGATGVAAHDVKDQTGFRVIYGPVRAADIKEFLAAGLKATGQMRTITFTLKERLKLIPVDIFYGKYFMILVPFVFFILAGLYPWGYSIDNTLHVGGRSSLNLLAAYLTGCVLTPALLPWIPFRRFSSKGLVMGWLLATIMALAGFLGTSLLEIISWFLLMGGLSSFMAMNFTGSSTFTSLSGVQKEMKVSVPVQICLTSLGFIGWILTRFLVK